MPVSIAHPMRAKFENRCPMCGKHIAKGELILKLKDGGVKCRACKPDGLAYESSEG